MNRAFRTISLALAFPALFFLFYWAKCQSGVDIFQNFKWEHYLPLDALQRKTPVLDASRQTDLIEEGFDGNLSGWSKLWSRSGSGRAAIRPWGVEGSRCVVIDHAGEQDWSFQREALIRVLPGQEFEYRCVMKADGKAQAGLILYDAGQEVLDWFYAASKPAAAEWTDLRKSFVVPEGAEYIRFRVSGPSRARVLLDNVSLKKRGLS